RAGSTIALFKFADAY
ncbi:hypothetical protein MTO96_043503, partial [Rhipicephalus appendiculatus]